MTPGVKENDRGLSVRELCRGQTSPGAGRGLAPGGGSVLEKSLTVWSRSAEPPPQSTHDGAGHGSDFRESRLVTLTRSSLSHHQGRGSLVITPSPDYR